MPSMRQRQSGENAAGHRPMRLARGALNATAAGAATREPDYDDGDVELSVAELEPWDLCVDRCESE